MTEFEEKVAEEPEVNKAPEVIVEEEPKEISVSVEEEPAAPATLQETFEEIKIGAGKFTNEVLDKVAEPLEKAADEYKGRIKRGLSGLLAGLSSEKDD